VGTLTFTEASTGPLVANNASRSYRVPKYATRVQWQSVNSPAAFIPPAAEILMTSGGDIAPGPVTVVAPPAATFVVLPNGVDWIYLRNRGDDEYSYTPIFEVCL